MPSVSIWKFKSELIIDGILFIHLLWDCHVLHCHFWYQKLVKICGCHLVLGLYACLCSSYYNQNIKHCHKLPVSTKQNLYRCIVHEIRMLIRSLPEKYGCTVLVSSHLLSEIELMAGNIGILNRGHLLFEGI